MGFGKSMDVQFHNSVYMTNAITTNMTAGAGADQKTAVLTQ
jgi:hypothetical protein